MSNEVAKRAEQPTDTVHVQSESAAIISMIERAARDPSVDIEKMERLFQMRNAIAAEQRKAAYISALARLQKALPVVIKAGTIAGEKKDGKAQLITKYAKWEDVCDAIRDPLQDHGFSISFRIAQPTHDRVHVTAVLGHEAGHSEETTMALPIDSSGGKNNVQGWGSAVSYGKRYTAFAMLNIAARGEDDDGKAAGETGQTASVNEINDLIAESKSNLSWFLQYFSVESLDDMTSRQRNQVRAMLKAKLAKGAQNARP